MDKQAERRIRRAWRTWQGAEERARLRFVAVVEELEQLGASQAEIARAAGTTRQNLWNILRRARGGDGS